MVQICPLSELPPDMLIQYLGEQGTPAEIVRWKYFDDCAGTGMERGFALVDTERIVGFLGLIPVDFRKGQHSMQCCWTCDWSVRKDVRGASGLKLLTEVKRYRRFALTLTDSVVTTKFLSRMAASIDSDAGVVYRKYLTVGGIAAALQRRGVPGAGAIAQLGAHVRIPTFSRQRLAVSVNRGLPPCDFERFHREKEHWRPSYTRAQLEWRLLRCPGLECWSTSADGARAAVVFWRAQQVPAEWRIALFAERGASDALRDCVHSALGKIVDEGGSAVNAMVSRWDHPLADVLQLAAFRKLRFTNTLFTLTSDNAADAIKTAGGITYLDSDFHYRF